jgi:diguanylate cyclase (GGDEF)-like protein
MNAEMLEEILSCPSLPSLPAVAVRVVELTKDTNVSMDELASSIQNDQALAAKVLRTVNSSFYGLRQRCTTIHQAIVMLGLSAVKSLALGFSLVSSLGGEDGDGFDYVRYWRRGLYTGVAAKCVAHAAGRDFEDEAFLGGLLQDIGMMVMFRALGDRYVAVLQETGGDHRKLVRCEIAALEVQHPDIGAMLAQRWKLPEELVLPVKYHERPTAAPANHTDLVRCVGVGNFAHDVLTDEDPTPALRRFHERVKSWFNIDGEQADELICKIAEGAKEISSLFKLDTGAYSDADEVLRRANERLVELSMLRDKEQTGEDGINALVKDGDQIDALTGAHTQTSMGLLLYPAFEAAKDKGETLGVVRVQIDGFASIAASHGTEVSDQVLVGVTALLKKEFESGGGLICRDGENSFVVLMPGVGRVGIVKAAEEFRRDLERAARAWTSSGAGAPVSVTASIGVAVMEPPVVFAKPETLLSAAGRAAEASNRAGGNCVRAYAPKKAA